MGNKTSRMKNLTKTPEIEQATEKLIEAMIEREKRQGAYIAAHRAYSDAKYAANPDPIKVEELRLAREKRLAEHWQAWDESNNINGELIAAYERDGKKYMGATSKGEFNMYTYREIDREVARRLHNEKSERSM